MNAYIHDACPKELVGRWCEFLWSDSDSNGTYYCVRLLNGDPVEYGEPDGRTVIATALGRMPPASPPPSLRGPDLRLCRWRTPGGGQ